MLLPLYAIVFGIAVDEPVTGKWSEPFLEDVMSLLYVTDWARIS